MMNIKQVLKVVAEALDRLANGESFEAVVESTGVTAAVSKARGEMQGSTAYCCISRDEIFRLSELVSLDSEQLAGLLQSGMDPTFRSLAGILNDAAKLGSRHLYDDIVNRSES